MANNLSKYADALAPVATNDSSDYLSTLEAAARGGKSFIGTPGLPGASTNLNPGSIVSSIPFGPLTSEQSRTINAFDTINSIFGTDLAPDADGVLAGTGLLDQFAPGGSHSSGTTSIWTDIFLRGTIIILGFIFVAVGLSMFKSSDLRIVTDRSDVLKGVKKSLKGRK